MENTEPIFKAVFGEQWESLPPVLQNHYSIAPYSEEQALAEGALDVWCHWLVKPFFWILRSIPPYSEKHVHVTVRFASEPHSAAFCFNRVFHFTDRKPVHFRSKMLHEGMGHMKEKMRWGICWHSHFRWDGTRIIMQHAGYSLQWGKLSIPMPVSWLIGRSDAEEIAVDNTHFDMRVGITHPLFGKIYSYKGRFAMKGKP